MAGELVYDHVDGHLLAVDLDAITPDCRDLNRRIIEKMAHRPIDAFGEEDDRSRHPLSPTPMHAVFSGLRAPMAEIVRPKRGHSP